MYNRVRDLSNPDLQCAEDPLVGNWHRHIRAGNWHTHIGAVNWHTHIRAGNWYTYIGAGDWHTHIRAGDCHTHIRAGDCPQLGALLAQKPARIYLQRSFFLRSVPETMNDRKAPI